MRTYSRIKEVEKMKDGETVQRVVEEYLSMNHIEGHQLVGILGKRKNRTRNV